MAVVETLEDVKKQILATFAPYLDGVHSVVLIGSWAHGEQEEGSDVDVVVICKQEAYRNISKAIWDQRISTAGEQPYFTYEVVNRERIRSPFTLGSPYANAIRHGLALIDDGHLSALVHDPQYPLFPTTEYYTHAFRKLILPWFLDFIVRLDRQIREDHGPGGICAEGERLSHIEGDILARLIMRMLYVTLPSRGRQPLSKRQLMRYSLEVYGQEIRAPLTRAVEIVREDRATDYDEYRLLRPVARKLLREVVSLLDKRTCRQIFDEARDITRRLRVPRRN